MRLICVRLKNFRSYLKETTIRIGDITALVGKNDIGKSSVFEALDIFFNGIKGSAVSADKEDLNIYSDEKCFYITCVFDDLPKEIVLDSSVSTSLKSEYLVNKDGFLEIEKKYDCSGAKIKEDVYFVCMHPQNETLVDLLQLKNAALKSRANDLGIDANQYDAKINSQIRNAIRRSCDDVILKETLLEANKDDCKPIYECVRKYMPMYALFQSDRSSSDSDKEVMDPMKVAISQALLNVQDQIDLIKKSVMNETLEIVEATLAKLKEMSPEIADKLQPEFVSEPKLDSLFKVRIKSDDNIPMNKRGSGVRRLLLLNFFRAEAERKMSKSNKGSVIYAIEEPETSQHPDYQSMLVQSFLQLVEKPNVQILITTHTPALASLLPIDSLRLIKRDCNGTPYIEANQSQYLNEICEELGVLASPIDNGVKAIVCVEGPGDVLFLDHIIKQYCENQVLSEDFKSLGIAIIPIGGCGTLKYWINQRLIEQFNVPWGILLDSDRGAETKTNNIKTVEELRAEGIKAYVTKKREIENYIAFDCIKEEVYYTDTDDAKKIIAKATNKRDTNVIDIFWPKMTFDQIRESERYFDDQGIVHYEFEDMINDFISLVQ